MKKVILIVILGFTFFSCNQNDPGDLVKTPEKISFSGILVRDERGLPLSEVDPDDWNIKDTWVEQEMSLFGSNLKTNCPATDYEIIGYPNPTRGQTAIHVYKPDSVRLAIRIVDKNLKTLFAKDSLYSKINLVDFSAFGITDTVRVYYKFINGGCEFRGHGDVVIRK
ncbi:hypothetical protein [Dyadobacter sp. 3J3]|uniref:hypothetical protein n=1 Tax=Dyadobacter sp. 3J3 TaxID=2606600 RepID=UPI00135A9D69|nr:hypothetical protein [Dyadobacter sp. 3J3]